MDLRNVCFVKDTVTILIDDLLKSSTQKFHLGGIYTGIKFPSYNDKLICRIEVLNGYIDLTGLFITTTKP